jgi:serine/threonine protein kinase
MATQPQSCLGRYELIREIARSNDVVYEAWDPHTHRRIAIKALYIPDGATVNQKEERTMRFEREARAAARLHHPNIVTLFDFGTDTGQPYLVLEFIDGPTLADVILNRGPLDADVATHFAVQLLSALGYAHTQGVVHRDIKPSNIFVCSGEHLKIADLGIARIESEQSVTSDGQIFGTPAYMSPEQVKGEPVDGRADIWAAGVVLYQMLTGIQPFTGGSVLEIGSNVIHTEPDLQIIQDHRIRGIIAKALAKDPAVRYLNAAEMSADLKTQAPATPAVVRPPASQAAPSQPTIQTMAIPVAKSRGSSVGAWVALLILAASVGTGAALLHKSGGQTAALPPAKGPETRTQVKSLDAVVSEAWEHNSLHEMAESEAFKLFPEGTQLDQYDTWCRTAIGQDYLALSQADRDAVVHTLMSRFGERAPVTFPKFQQVPPTTVIKPPFPSNQPLVTAGAPPMSNPQSILSAPPAASATMPVPGPANVSQPPMPAQNPQPAAPAQTSEPPVDTSALDRARRTNAAAMAAPASGDQGRRYRHADPEMDSDGIPVYRAPDLDDLVVLRRLNFHADRMIIRPGGVREYIGPRGVLRIR